MHRRGGSVACAQDSSSLPVAEDPVDVLKNDWLTTFRSQQDS